MTEKRRTITERINEVYEILLHHREPITLLELSISMDMSSKYLREEILPVTALVHPDVEIRIDKNNPSKIYLFLLTDFSSKRS